VGHLPVPLRTNPPHPGPSALKKRGPQDDKGFDDKGLMAGALTGALKLLGVFGASSTASGGARLLCISSYLALLECGVRRMSGWWFVALLLPVISLVATILWCVKICQARGKSSWLGLLLLLPVTNIFTFLYLAFADGASEKEDAPGRITFD